MPPTFQELQTFEVDDPSVQTDEDKNTHLAALLLGPWLDLSIVRVERIEIGSQHGWRVTFRR